MPVTTFERELKSFKARLTQSEQSTFTDTTIDDLHLTVASIQKTQISERTNKNITRLRTFLEAIESLSKILDLFVNISDFVAFVWGPIKYLLLVASTYTDAFTALLDTYQSIGRHLPQLKQYQALFEHDGSMQEVLGCMFKNIFDFHLRALRYFQASKWKQIFKAHVFRSKFADIIDDLRQHKELVERQADLVEFQEARQARDDAQQHYEEHEAQEQLRRRLFMQDWLDAPNMAGQQEKGQLTREARPRSGQWLLSRDKVKAWLDPAMSVAACLWVHGIPGAGKTVLASLLIDRCKTIPHVRTIYFYCRHGDQQSDNFISMARSLLDQLSHLESSIVDMLYDMAAKRETCFKTRKDTEELLQLCLDAAGTLYIVVDGLDECAEPEQKAIARWLRKYADNSGATRDPTRCVFLSQDDATTRALLSTSPTVRITPSDNKDDIKAYCSAIAKDIQAKFAESDAGAVFIVEAVTTKANGMFLYAKLVMDNLFHQVNLAMMRAELHPQVFPNGLEQAYGRILKRILDETRPAYCKGARKILAWLVCAMRTLKWREIQCAISTDADAGIIDPSQRLVVQPKEICGSLVEQQSDGSLQLVHTTARLFLVSTKVIHEPQEHLKLSRLCLDQFGFSMFDEKLEDDDIATHILSGEFAFFEYSIVNWIPHLLASVELDRRGALPKLSEDDLSELAEILSIYLEVHGMTPKKKSRASRNMISAIKYLPQLDNAQRTMLLRTMASANSLVSSDLQSPKLFEASKLYSILRKVRLVMEDLAVDPSAQANIALFYGTQVFKCPRLYCKWFYEGFDTAAKRSEHVAKHERSYFCPYIGCAHATLGCKTAGELELHYQTYHKPSLTGDDFPLPPVPPVPPLVAVSAQATPAPTTQPPASPIPTIASPLSANMQTGNTATKRPGPDTALQQTPSKRPRQIGPFQCESCPKIFQRVSHLRSHNRIHSDEKPFSCVVCGKSFARQPDLTRHGLLHSGDKRFSCCGSLRNGRQWGCNKRFMRLDGLARHWKGTAGTFCVKPLRDEEASLAHQQVTVTSATTALATPTPAPMLRWDDVLLSAPQHGTEMYAYDDQFPLALYDQHPEMSAINWDIVLPE